MGLDNRLPIGLLSGVISFLVVVFGAFSDKTTYQRSLDLNANLAWGTVLLVCGAAMVILGRRQSAIRSGDGSSADAAEGKQR